LDECQRRRGGSDFGTDATKIKSLAVVTGRVGYAWEHHNLILQRKRAT
jgi:hypothetical protein